MHNKLQEAAAKMIFSASGWRGVFAESGNGEDPGPAISDAHKLIAAAAAVVFSDFLEEEGISGSIIVGRDTRPSGEAIADAVLRSLLAKGRPILFPGVSPAPEIMAYAKAKAGVAGFIYISASHNPIGHNGIKFGLNDGGVLQGDKAAILIKKFKEFIGLVQQPGCLSNKPCKMPRRLPVLAEFIRKLKFPNNSISAPAALRPAEYPGDLQSIYAISPRHKEEAKNCYFRFTREVIFNLKEEADLQSSLIFDSIKAGLKEHPLSIAADFNGSARTVSIDREFLNSLGIGFAATNDKSGEIRHRIVPEGESLEPCRLFLEELHHKDPSFLLGYVPDCDGDRGNLVIWEEGEKRARALEAQEVFALVCMAELSYLVWNGDLKYDNKGNVLVKSCVVVNDPTSLRIDKIAMAFDLPVFRAEVGEANVVGLARKLRNEGSLVRILGEGSAGGNITHPSAVRDPIDTVGAIIKLLTIRSTPEKKGLYELWCDLSGGAALYSGDFTLEDIIASLPAFVTTGAYSACAVLKVKTEDHALLKNRYQGIFLKEWESRKDELKAKYGIAGWDVTAYNGLEERRSIEKFGEAGKGGLKIGFKNSEGRLCACIWMRGSATEPVFRIMADAEGQDKRLERDLIAWQRQMVEEADRAGV
jgi:phosphoglucomutase